MENRFTKCSFDFEVVSFHSECDRSSCKGNQDPAFAVFYQRANNEYCYCLNRKQLGQYWRCIVEDTNFLCLSRCERCKACKEMSHVFTELQDAYFCQPKTKPAKNYEDKSYQPVMWHVYNRPSNKKEFRMESNSTYWFGLRLWVDMLIENLLFL